MKGNRLNTAANVGTFVTGRQSLKVQRQMAADLSVLANAERNRQAEAEAQRQAQIAEAKRQALEAERKELSQWATGQVEAGRMSASEAETFVESTLFNRHHPAPAPSRRVTPSISTGMQTIMDRTPGPGWYKEEGGLARYWRGDEWSLERLSIAQARKAALDEWSTQDSKAADRSRKVAGLLGIFLGTLGVHRFYLGYTVLGIIQLLVGLLLFVPTFGLIALWGLMEGILFLTSSSALYQRDARGVPLR